MRSRRFDFRIWTHGLVPWPLVPSPYATCVWWHGVGLGAVDHGAKLGANDLGIQKALHHRPFLSRFVSPCLLYTGMPHTTTDDPDYPCHPPCLPRPPWCPAWILGQARLPHLLLPTLAHPKLAARVATPHRPPRPPCSPMRTTPREASQPSAAVVVARLDVGYGPWPMRPAHPTCCSPPQPGMADHATSSLAWSACHDVRRDPLASSLHAKCLLLLSTASCSPSVDR